MSIQPTLLVLAAGLGSRYGGLKQMDPMGPNGELIIDYSVYDALRAGFGRVVFVIRPDIRRDFEELIASRFAGRVPITLVEQTLDKLPAGYAVPAERKKPWGTGHAILMAAEAIHEPFCVINGDDFYGAAAYRLIAEALSNASSPDDWAMVAYILRNTLSEHGSVARGICTVDAGKHLAGVVERTTIEKVDNAARFADEAGGWQPLTGDELVSLNFWGFQPSIFGQLERRFRGFLDARIEEPKAEYFIPTVVDQAIADGEASVTVATSPDSWFGVTYPDDKAAVMASLRRLIAEGAYPERLWA